MVNDTGQLYTIEGVAAGLIMIMTAYLVVSATSVYTPGDAHISDMQLEVLGSDALNLMGTPQNYTAESPLRQIIETDDGARFKTTFDEIINTKTGTRQNSIQYTANYTYHVAGDNTIGSAAIASSRDLTGGEHVVRATKWVMVNKNVGGTSITPPPQRVVLVEVLLWRD